MTKLIILIVIVTIMTTTYQIIYLEDIIEGEDIYITFYVNDEIYLPNVITNRGGNGYELKVKQEYANEVRKQIKEITGESITFRGNIDIAYDILNNLNARIISTEEIGNIRFINGYTRQFRKNVRVEDEIINIQIAIREDGIIIIGTPIIIGSC